MSLHTRWFSVALWLAFACAPAAANAQPARVTALSTCVQQYEAGELDPAEACLNRVLASSRAPGARGRAHQHLGLVAAARRQMVQAREAFKAALIDDPELDVDRSRVPPEVTAEWDAARGLILGTLRVDAPEAGARVLVDGAERGLTPAALRIAVGRHKVDVVSADGFRRWSGGTVLLRHEGTVALRADFATQVGRVRARVQPADAELRLDGRVLQRDATGAFVMPAGRHRVVVYKSGHAEVEREVTVRAFGEAELVATLLALPSRGLVRKVGWAVLGTGGALLVGGLVSGVLARSASDDITTRFAAGTLDTPTYRALRDSADQRALMANVLYGVGAGAVIGGVLMVVLGGPTNDAPPARVTVHMHPGGAGLAFRF